MRLAVAPLLVCFSAALYSQVPTEPALRAPDQPQYPVLARTARIQGIVKIQFSLNASGETFGVQVLSGHPLLSKAAVDAVKTWRFTLPAGGTEPDRKYETTFEFEFAGVANQLRDTITRTTVEWQSFHLVRIKTPLMSETQAKDCPATEVVAPPSSKRQEDFIELSRSGCYGSCPIYTVRVPRSGKVEWHGQGFVKTVGDGSSTVDPGRVDQIMEQFRSAQFWSLCGYYTRSVTDNPTVILTASIGGDTKTIEDYADSGPPWLRDLGRAVDDLANTHQWRHGDPKAEPISNILADAWYAKPGVTSLMRAASDEDLQRLHEVIEGGADVSAEDSSGWTALTYGAANWKDGPVEILLDAGADPNHASAIGDTPLMAYATHGYLSEDLISAGARINDQNKSGVSTLMILATRAKPAEIADALRAGANAMLRDERGRTALDYLRASNCNRDPLRNELNEFMTFEGRRCDALDRDDFRKSEQILREAMRKRR